MQWQVENVLAAVTIAALSGVPKQTIVQTIQEFSGLEHRLEWVRSYQGVDYINDSKSTNVGSVLKSINTVGFGKKPVFLFLHI